MKTSLTLLWIAVAGLAAFTIYEAKQSHLRVPFCLDLTTQGVRVKVKDCDIDNFKTRLNGYLKCNSGLNLLYQNSEGKWETVDGPPFKNPRPAQPDGSMHVTQSIQLNGLDQLNAVIDLLAPGTQNVPVPTTTTSTHRS